MFIIENVPLSIYSTMRLGGVARFVTDVSDRQDVTEAVAWAKEKSLPVIMIGQGSNIIWSDKGFDGLLLINKIMGIEVFEEDDENIYVTSGAGELWDDVVNNTVDNGYSGIEQLSLIPGTAGATPVQNVGAYGRETADVLTTVEAFDTQTNTFITIPASECEFGYRTSRFKTHDKGRYLITKVTFHLTKAAPSPPFYSALESYLLEHDVKSYNAKEIRKAVIAIRNSKLPNPAKIANVGSFFHNPIVDSKKAFNLANKYPDMPHWPLKDDTTKLSAAWLIEQAGYKDFHDTKTGMATWHLQPLVLVNEKATSTKDLLNFKQIIVTGVKEKFGIDLQQEPELIGPE